MNLHGYSIRAQQVCRWPQFAPTAQVYGVELEIEPRSGSSQSAVLNALGHNERDFFCKADGSLDSGVEIVTVPGTLEWHTGHFCWPGLLRPVLNIAMAGARTRRCGMHIHVNRGCLSQLTLAKLMLCVNDPGMKPVIILLAQRDPTSWARLIKKEWSNALRPGPDASRYQAINLTRQTAEFRIFRSSLRADRVLKNIEAVDALIQWCRDTSAAKIVDGPGFVRYASDNGRWPNLAKFLRDTGAADLIQGNA